MYIPKQQNTPWQANNDIDLKRTAILVIDLLGGSQGVIDSLKEAVKNAVSIVNEARKINMPIIFSNDAHLLNVDNELKLWGNHGIKDSEAAKVLDEFDLQKTDYIVTKRRYNGFFQTDLDLLLRELNVDTLIVCGADTNICVLQTLAGAYFLNYKTIVAADACATFLIGNQEQGLEYFSKCYDSRVILTEEVLKYFK